VGCPILRCRKYLALSAALVTVFFWVVFGCSRVLQYVSMVLSFPKFSRSILGSGCWNLSLACWTLLCPPTRTSCALFGCTCRSRLWNCPHSSMCLSQVLSSRQDSSYPLPMAHHTSPLFFVFLGPSRTSRLSSSLQPPLQFPSSQPPAPTALACCQPHIPILQARYLGAGALHAPSTSLFVVLYRLLSTLAPLFPIPVVCRQLSVDWSPLSAVHCLLSDLSSLLCSLDSVRRD
jgi:hypothetical protein